mmetsp:Transcript_8287/g.19143  ORF Transcript_8287/g.19143 Transcript_8287/m.19143 type:complete len:134 (+) Transcript_8287:58-459(+)
MRNRGPGQWREWRYGSTVVTLYPIDPKKPVEEGVKSINDIAFQTIKAVNAKSMLPKLTDAIADMVKEPDSPGGRIQEDRFRKLLQDTCVATLDPEEVEAIFPKPVVAEEQPVATRQTSKRKSSRSSSKLAEGT